MVVVGDTSLAEIKPKIEALFKDWARASVPAKNLKSVPASKSRTVYVIDRPGSIQSVILAGQLAPPTNNPDEVAFKTLTQALGGSFTARINMNLREDKHWSYGAYSFIGDAKGQRAYLFYAPVQTDKTKESVVELLKEVRSIGGEKPITEAELGYAKTARVRGYAQQFESLGRIAGQVAELWALGLPMSELEREPSEIEKTTLAAADAAARKYAAAGSFTLLLVGDASKIEGPLQQLKLGEVVRLDAEGRAAPRQ